MKRISGLYGQTLNGLLLLLLALLASCGQHYMPLYYNPGHKPNYTKADYIRLSQNLKKYRADTLARHGKPGDSIGTHVNKVADIAKWIKSDSGQNVYKYLTAVDSLKRKPVLPENLVASLERIGSKEALLNKPNVEKLKGLSTNLTVHRPDLKRKLSFKEKLSTIILQMYVDKLAKKATYAHERQTKTDRNLSGTKINLEKKNSLSRRRSMWDNLDDAKTLLVLLLVLLLALVVVSFIVWLVLFLLPTILAVLALLAVVVLALWLILSL